ncbi:unnamed protein product [Victoria cruziana]
MTVTLNEFFNLMGLPLPKEDPRSPITGQYLRNEVPVNIPDVIRRLTGKKSWPMLNKNHQQYIRLEDLAKEYSEYINPDLLSRKRAGAYKQAMLTAAVGFVFLYNRENTIDLKTARLLRNWGHPKSKHLSIDMASLAFIYRGLNKFVSEESNIIEGSNSLIQA